MLGMTDLQRDWRGCEGRVSGTRTPASRPRHRRPATGPRGPDNPRPRDDVSISWARRSGEDNLRTRRASYTGSALSVVADTMAAVLPTRNGMLADHELVERDFNAAYLQIVDLLDRRAADRDLYDRLKAVNFTGPEYDKFANALAAYGIAVVTALLLSGKMFELCAAHHRPVGSRPQTWTEHDIAGLTNDTVTEALIAFRHEGLAGEGWEYSEDGASLNTYFITGCVLKFSNVYRKWERAERHWRSLHDLCETLEDIPTDVVGTPDVATTIERRQEAAVSYAGLSEKERRIVYYAQAGYSNAEIAELLGMASPRAVEGALYRIRQRANKRREQEGGEHE